MWRYCHCCKQMQITRCSHITKRLRGTKMGETEHLYCGSHTLKELTLICMSAAPVRLEFVSMHSAGPVMNDSFSSKEN